MKRRTVDWCWCIYLVALCFMATSTSHSVESEVLVLPKGVPDNGNSGAQISADSAFRFQQVVHASQLVESMPDAAWITGISFRAGGGTLPGDTYSVSFMSAEVLLSTTSAEPGALSGTFADNWGADARTVFNQQNYDWVMPVVDGTTSFSPAMSADAPFLYNPNSGNLLIDVVLRGPSTETSIDFHGSFEDQSNGIGFTRFGDGSPTPITALNPNNFGMAPVRIEFQRVPEPGSALLLLCGVAFLGMKRLNSNGREL